MKLDFFKQPVPGFSPALFPCDDHSVEIFKGVEIGKIYTLDMKQPRWIGFHRKFFKMIREVMAHQPYYVNERQLLTEIKLRMGHVDSHIRPTGELIYVPASIAFNEMDNLQFQWFYGQAIDVILQHIIQGHNRELENKIIGFI